MSNTMTYKITKTDAEWQALLKDKGGEPMAYQVTRHEATERAFTGRLADQHAAGPYRCICCDKPLFDSATKYESGSGWPSFFQPLSQDAVETQEDRSAWLGVRTEVHCANCGGHLGHVFPDGPAPTGLRYCLNGAALSFNCVATP